MKNAIQGLLFNFILFTWSINSFGQTPTLGSTSSFAFFTAIGAFNNLGASHIAGDIGTNVGALTGFPPGTISGQIHVSDPVTVQAALDINTAYSYLSGVVCNTVLGTTLGNNQELTPGNYCVGAAATLNSNLILNGQGDANSFFLIKIDGALSTNSFSSVQLINGASASNIYWQINGQVALGESSSFKGTILANGAIILLEAATLEGRGLSRAGAISLHNNVSSIGASVLNLKLYFQTYYRGVGLMDHVLMNDGVIGSDISHTDTITVELRNPAAPFAVEYSCKTIVNTDGIAMCDFPISGSFYIAIKHRSAVQTWSKNPVSIYGKIIHYNFTDSITKAYGNNLKMMESNVFAIYTGDINQDDNVDLIDLILAENDNVSFLYGYYSTDLNGDGNVDLLDFPELENNINNFVYSYHP